MAAAICCCDDVVAVVHGGAVAVGRVGVSDSRLTWESFTEEEPCRSADAVACATLVRAGGHTVLVTGRGAELWVAVVDGQARSVRPFQLVLLASEGGRAGDAEPVWLQLHGYVPGDGEANVEPPPAVLAVVGSRGRLACPDFMQLVTCGATGADGAMVWRPGAFGAVMSPSARWVVALNAPDDVLVGHADGSVRTPWGDLLWAGHDPDARAAVVLPWGEDSVMCIEPAARRAVVRTAAQGHRLSCVPLPTGTPPPTAACFCHHLNTLLLVKEEDKGARVVGLAFGRPAAA